MKCGRHVFLGTLLLLVVGALMHFSFEWLGGWRPLGLIFPVNESVFEHLKLVFYPMVVYWLIAAPKKGALFAPLALGVFTAIFLVLSLFYILEGGFGIESLVADIVVQAFGILVGQLVICNALRSDKKRKQSAGFVGALFVIVFAAAIMYFTYQPPKLPIFRDPPTGGYGIVKHIDN